MPPALLLILSLRSFPAAPAIVRRALADCPEDVLPAAAGEQAGMLLTELVTSVVAEGRLRPADRIRVELRRDEDGIRASVRHPRRSPGVPLAAPPPRARRADADAARAAILDGLAEDWGCDASQREVAAWFRLGGPAVAFRGPSPSGLRGSHGFGSHGPRA